MSQGCAASSTGNCAVCSVLIAHLRRGDSSARPERREQHPRDEVLSLQAALRRRGGRTVRMCMLTRLA